MATVEENLRALFLDQDAIADLVAGRVVNNVPVNDESGDPLVFIQLSSTDDELTLDAPIGYQAARYHFAIECWAATETLAVNVANAVKGLNLYGGEFGDSTVQGIFIDNMNETYEPTIQAQNMHGVFLDAEVVP